MSATFIVAEMGVNHNGDINLAKCIIAAAANAGADAVKTQSFYAETLASKHAKKAAYQKKADSDNSQLNMLKQLEVSGEMFSELQCYAQATGIVFFSTPFDLQSIRDLKELGNPIFKIPSGEITNLPYLIKIAELSKPTVLSSGMSTLEEVRQAVDVLRKYGCNDLTLLHCNTQYPTPVEDANVRAMVTLREEFWLPVGYSDHTRGMEAALAAVALGAVMVEKHFTLSNEMEGPDHRASMEPEPFARMVKAIRNLELALGSEEKTVSASERDNMAVARKSIVALCAIKKGEMFTEQNITAKRPGNGISPMKWFEVLGRKAKRDFEEDELIEL